LRSFTFAWENHRSIFSLATNKIRKKRCLHMSAVTPVTPETAAPAPAPPAAASESELQPQSLRDLALGSTLSSVCCYGMSRCVIQATAANGQPVLVNCQHTLSVDDAAALALLRNPGAMLFAF
jgi:hypothetical protein